MENKTEKGIEIIYFLDYVLATSPYGKQRLFNKFELIYTDSFDQNSIWILDYDGEVYSIPKSDKYIVIETLPFSKEDLAKLSNTIETMPCNCGNCKTDNEIIN